MRLVVRCADTDSAATLTVAATAVTGTYSWLDSGCDVELLLAGTPEVSTAGRSPAVVLAPLTTLAQAVAVLQLGARGYLPLDAPPRRLGEALRVISRGHLCVGPETAQACQVLLMATSGMGDLNSDLKAALNLAANGWPWRNVASVLGRHPGELADDVAMAAGL